MFERYIEKARRVIFFARYEASQFGSIYIDTEHLLLGLLREDKPLAEALLQSRSSLDSIRSAIEAHSPKRSGLSTSVDLPLSSETKRVLAYSAEEADRLHHRHIAPPHLLLGILREPNCFAARLLHERHVTIDSARAYASQDASGPAAGPSSALFAILADREKTGGIAIAANAAIAGQHADFAIFDPADILAPDHSVAILRKKISQVLRAMEAAITSHEFEAARQYSDEERRLRQELNAIHNPNTPEPIPRLCILLLRDESLSILRARIDSFLKAGVPHVWLLDPTGRRAYTATPAEGLRESTTGILHLSHPTLELNVASLFH